MIILDTHVWIWLASSPRSLSKAAAKKIQEGNLALAAISCWELCMLVQKRRIALNMNPLDWIEESLRSHQIELLPLTPVVAVRSTQLGADFHGDPADRLIVATVLAQGAVLVTKDDRIRSYSAVETIW